MKALVGILALLGLCGAASAGNSTLIRLTRTTYIGGSHFDSAFGIAEAPDHTLYVVGTTRSLNFPVSAGAAQTRYGGGTGDIFVAHFSPGLNRLLNATYIGGSGEDRGFAVTYDARNNRVYVVGSTYSPDFPDTGSGAQPQYAGNGDTVVVELTPNLAYMRATYLGGSGDDTPGGSFSEPSRTMAIGISPANGDIYVAGTTDSTDFPKTAAGAQPANGGLYDGYVAALTPSLHRILRATYLGGSGEDIPSSMAFDEAGDVYVAGATDSPDFPDTAAGAQSALSGSQDAFVVALQPNLTAIENATYLGGTHLDVATGIAMSTRPNYLYVVGSTNSTDFPKTLMGAQPHNAGNSDAFVAALTRDLKNVAIATYLGGSSLDTARPAIAVSPTNGSVYVAGTTVSSNFPDTVNGVQSQYPGGTYASFVTHLTEGLTQIIQSTYLGGSTNHTGVHDMLIDPVTLHVYTAGGSGAADLPNTGGAYDSSFNGGGRDAIVSAFNPTLTPQ